MGFAKRCLGLCVVLVVAACGGGKSDPKPSAGSVPEPASSTLSASPRNGVVQTPAGPTEVASTPQVRMEWAMASADASVLTTDDTRFLVTSALSSLQDTQTQQDTLIKAFYDGLSTQFDLINESFMVQPDLNTSDKVFPLVVGDKGNMLASISTLNGNRIAGYGYDILSGFDPLNLTQIAVRTPQPLHKPVFKRVLAWLVNANPAMDWSDPNLRSFNVAWSSLPTTSAVLYTRSDGQKVYRPYAEAGLKALGMGFNSLNCDPLVDPISSCASNAQLVIIGAIDQRKSVSELASQLTRLQDIVKAKIPILYLNAHPSGGAPNDYARAAFKDDFPRLQALGFASGDIPDKRNYYTKDFVASGQNTTPVNPLFRHMANLLTRLKDQHFNAYDWANCFDDACVVPAPFASDIQNSVNFLRDKLNELNANGQTLFQADVNNRSIRQFVLWADTYRRSIAYPIDKVLHPEKFQSAYIADSLVAYVRNQGVAQSALGNYLPDKAQNIKGSADFETVDVTLPGTDGFTAVGRFVLPGQPVEIKFSDTPPVGVFKFKLNILREGSNKKWESTLDKNGADKPSSGLRRPLYLRSPEFPLNAQGLTVVSPYGGMLNLVFNGATDSKVSLRIKGAARHPFFDTTQGVPDVKAFLDAVKSTDLGWMEIKTPGMEVHSIIVKALALLEPSANETYDQRAKYPNAAKPYYQRDTGVDMAKYLAEAKKYVMEAAYQLAGYRALGLELKPGVQQVCNDLLWDCTNPRIHKPPTIQHFQIDMRANCGSMCSGQPIDSSSGFEPRGWGESHEMGHNLQRFHVYDGMSGEVSNNIFPLHSKWLAFRDLGRDQVGYRNELDETQVVFDLIKKAYKDPNLSTVESKRASVRSILWSNSAYASYNRSRLYFYLQWPLIYFETLREKNPKASEASLWDQAWDIYTLMYLNSRLIESTSPDTWSSVNDRLGFGQYAAKPATSSKMVPINGVETFPHHDYLLVMLSKLTGRDQRPLFDLWGIETYPDGRNQVARMGLQPQPTRFYAVVCADDYRSWRSVALDDANPTLPAEWGADVFKDQASNLAACKAATASDVATP